MQSATFGRFCNYNGCLKVGSSPEGLYLSPIVFFRAGHPALLVPWNEIRVEGVSVTLFVQRMKLNLGSTEQVPFSISEKLATQLEQEAGIAWPAKTLSAR